MFERFTDRARRVVDLARHEARTLGHNYIGTEHILLALIREGGGAAQLLAGAGVDHDRARQQVTERPRRVAISDPVQALLDSIDDRLSAIERHLGMNPGGPENVIPPS